MGVALALIYRWVQSGEVWFDKFITTVDYNIFVGDPERRASAARRIIEARADATWTEDSFLMVKKILKLN